MDQVNTEYLCVFMFSCHRGVTQEVTHDPNLELGVIHQPVTRATGDEAEYTRLQRQLEGYKQLQENPNVIMEREDESAEYAEILDAIRSQSATNDPQEQPAEYEEVLDSTRYDSQSQYDGCVDFVDYPDNIPTNEYDGQVQVFDYEAAN